MKKRTIYQQETRGLIIALVLMVALVLFMELYDHITALFTSANAGWLTALFTVAILVITCVVIMYRRVSHLKKEPTKNN